MSRSFPLALPYALLGLSVAGAGAACNALLGNQAIVFEDPLDGSTGVDAAVGDSRVDPPDTGPACTGEACERIVFVTSGSFQGALGGINGADDLCNGAAAAVGSVVRGRRFVAWLSESLTFANVRLVHGSSRYVRTDGRLVALAWSQLVSGNLLGPIDHDETGALRMPSGPEDVWTGTETTGDRRLPTCDDWRTSSPESLGTTGTWSAVDSTWTANRLEHFCSTPAALYCIER